MTNKPNNNNTPAREPLPPIRFGALADALLSMSESLVPMWLPGGRRNGHEYVCGSLSGGEGGSCSVNLTTGRWADFSSDEAGGDLVSLYAAVHGLSMAKAAVDLAHQFGLEDVAGVVKGGAGNVAPPVRRAPEPAPAVPKAAEGEGWRTVLPVPAFAPAPTFKHFHRQPEDITHTFEYRVGDDLHGFVVRFRDSQGGKETLPYTWCASERSGSAKWNWRQWDEPRPLYLPGRVLPSAEALAGITVVIVEGERKGNVLHDLLDVEMPGVYLVVGWPGGSKAWAKAAWGWLAGAKTVLLWPDCDAQHVPLTAAERKGLPDKAARDAALAANPLLPEAKQPGWKCMVGLGHHLRDVVGVESVQVLRIPAPGAVVGGWDAADAIEVDGWGVDEVLRLFASAFALPALPGKDDDAGGPAAAAPDAGASASAGKGGATSAKKIDGLADAEGASGGGDGGMPRWLAPYYDADKGRWMVSRKTVIAALTHDEALAGVLGLNQLSNNIEARRAWPWPHGEAGPIKGSTDLLLGRYLSNAYGLPAITRAALIEAIETVAHESPFHPIQDYLQGLKWDGRKRIDLWLVYALGETKETLAAPVYEYLCLVGRYLLLGMVNRAMDPGCKFDYCPVFEGAGGLGKSTLVEVLASEAWFSDTHFDVSRGKEGQEQVQGLWVYEIAELSQFGKAEIQLIKAFISAKVDRYRPSYGRVVESYPRACVMVGTTNEKTYLRDRTGNRRFWPVPVTQRINNPWVRERRDQLLAEAFELFLQGAQYYPSAEEEARLFVPMQESRLVDTAVMGELLNVLTRPPKGVDGGIQAVVNELADFVTLPQLTLALGVDAAKSSPALEAQIRGWMEHEGWTKAKKQVNGARHWGWVRPDNWPPQEAVEVAGGAAAEPSGINDEEEADDAPF